MVLNDVNVYYKDLESYVVVDFRHGLFIQIFRQNEFIVIRINRIYAYQLSEKDEPIVAIEHGMMINMFPNAQTFTQLCFEEVNGIRLSFKPLDEYLVENGGINQKNDVAGITNGIYNYLELVG